MEENAQINSAAPDIQKNNFEVFAKVGGFTFYRVGDEIKMDRKEHAKLFDSTNCFLTVIKSMVVWIEPF